MTKETDEPKILTNVGFAISMEGATRDGKDEIHVILNFLGEPEDGDEREVMALRWEIPREIIEKVAKAGVGEQILPPAIHQTDWILAQTIPVDQVLAMDNAITTKPIIPPIYTTTIDDASEARKECQKYREVEKEKGYNKYNPFK